MLPHNFMNGTPPLSQTAWTQKQTDRAEDEKSTVGRVERRLRKQPKKDLGMVKSDLGSNCAEFNLSMGGRKQLLPSEAT